MSTRTVATTLVLSAALASVVVGCGDDDDDGVTPADAASLDAALPDAALPDAALPDAALPDAALPDAALPDAATTPVTFSCTGTAPGADHHQYVLSAIAVPTNATQAQQLGLDLDGDPVGRPDNAMGQILSTVAAQGDIDIQAVMDAAIASGEVRHVLDVRAVELSADGSATGHAFFAADCDDPVDTTDDFSGSEPFGPAPDAIADPLAGTVVGATVRLAGEGGRIELPVSVLGGAVIRVPLVGAKLEARVVAGRIAGGKIGGAMLPTDLDAIFLPALAAGLQDIVDSECTGTAPQCCPDGSTGETLLDLFDANLDCTLTATELRENDLVASLLAPDVDLFDATGAYNPSVDGVKAACPSALDSRLPAPCCRSSRPSSSRASDRQNGAPTARVRNPTNGLATANRSAQYSTSRGASTSSRDSCADAV